MIRSVTAAVVTAAGKVRSLVARKEPDEEITEAQVSEPKTLARLQMRILRDLAALKRRPMPRRVDYEDVIVNGDGASVYLFAHGFGGRVRWWVVDCLDSNGALRLSDRTTEDQLALVSDLAGVVTVRIEEVGG